jgi:lipoate-protein ligase A
MPLDESSRRRLDLIVQAGLTPSQSLAAARYLLDAVAAARSPGSLRVFDLTGDVVSLGRYHLAPEAVAGSTTTLVRRLSGGRAVPAGTGFVGMTLVLPHRAALVAGHPSALAPEQVMNRCVRGLLQGLEGAGVAAFYPGRDLVTVAGRTLGLVSFEVEPGGALLFEAVLASGRDFSLLAQLLDGADPTGIVPIRMVAPDETTSLARELGRVPETSEVARWMAAGYAARFDLSVVPSALPASDIPVVDAETWLGARRPRPELDRRGTTSTQLGVFEAHFGVREGALAQVVLAGDFIASSDTIARLEQALVGCAAERNAIDAVVRRVLAEDAHFILGIGPLATIADTFARGLA